MYSFSLFEKFIKLNIGSGFHKMLSTAIRRDHAHSYINHTVIDPLFQGLYNQIKDLQNATIPPLGIEQIQRAAPQKTEIFLYYSLNELKYICGYDILKEIQLCAREGENGNTVRIR